MLQLPNPLTEEQQSKWDQLVQDLGHIARATKAPLVFHGTNFNAAKAITESGFVLSHLYTATPEGLVTVHQGTYWGNLRMASDFARSRQYQCADEPAVLVAPIDAVQAAGPLAPDFYTWETDYWSEGPEKLDYSDAPRNWQASLQRLGAFTMIGGRRVDNLVLVSLSSPNLDLVRAIGGCNQDQDLDSSHQVGSVSGLGETFEGFSF